MVSYIYKQLCTEIIDFWLNSASQKALLLVAFYETIKILICTKHHKHQ